MKFKKYVHKYVEVVSKNYVIKLKDQREETPGAEVVVTIFPAGKTGGMGVPFEKTFNIEEATELRDALNKVLKHAPKKVKATE